jgi:hypothetical protein
VGSGLTAVPLETELRWATSLLGVGEPAADGAPASVGAWLLKVQAAVLETNAQFPFLAYGMDWLAFGHFVIALAFLGALRDPVRNRWLFDFGLVACGLVVPYALVSGALRGIPWFWRLIDCSFGVFGAAPLWLCRCWVRELQANDTAAAIHKARASRS